MAKSKVTQGTRTPKKRAEKPVSEGIRRAAEKIGATPSESAKAPAGVRTVVEREVIDGIPTLGLPDRPDEYGETRAARVARRAAEGKLLTCSVPGSLGAKVRQLLGQGLWLDPDAPDTKNARSMSGRSTTH